MERIMRRGESGFMSSATIKRCKKSYLKRIFAFVLAFILTIGSCGAFPVVGSGKVLAATEAGRAVINASGNSWTLENDTLKTVISFSNGSIKMKSFYNKSAGKEYLNDNSDSYLFSYTYGEYINGTVWSYNDYKTNGTVPSAGKNTVTLRSDDGSWTLGETKITDITMNTGDGKERLGKQLEITITNSANNFQNRLVFSVYDGEAGFHYQNYVKNTGSKKMVITDSDVISLSFPNGPHYLHYINAKTSSSGGAENSTWKTITGSLVKNTGRNALNVYTAGDGFWIMPETNWRTQDGPDVAGSTSEGTKTFNEFATTSVIAGGSSEANASVIKVACVGDSITEGIGASSGKSYPAQLRELLGSAFEVKNFGVSGRTLLKKGDYPYWNESKFTESKAYLPDVVIIMLGTNDSKTRNWNYKSEFKSNYIELINQYKSLASNPKIYLATSPIALDNVMGIRKDVIANEIIPLQKEIAKEAGCEMIDINTFTKGHDDWFGDGVHPNNYGYSQLAGYFSNYVNAYKKDSMGNMVVKVSTNPQSLQLTLKAGEEFRYIGVNIAVFKGDVVDGKMAAEEHFYKRFKFHDTSTIINTNDWDYIGKRSYNYFDTVVIPKAKQAKIDMIMLDDLWNTTQDSIVAIDSLRSLADISGLIKNSGFKFGLWYSLSGGHHNKGRDLADPQMIREKKELIRSLIVDYKLDHQMVDLTEFWQNKTETSYSSPCDNVYRKNVLSNTMLNELVEEYPQYLVKYTNEVDVYPTQGNRSTGLIHLTNNGWIVHNGGLDGLSIGANSFGYLPLDTYYNGGSVNGDMSMYYNYMFARNTKLNTDPGGKTWTDRGIEVMAMFNDWRNGDRVKELTNSLKRPTYLGEGWSKNAGSDTGVKGPYSWMYTNTDKTRGLMISTSYTSTAKKFTADTRWLDSNKKYYVADVTLDDVGQFTYKYMGVYNGSDLVKNGFEVDLTENTSGGKAIWFEAVGNDSMQVVYADENTKSYTSSVSGNELTVNVEGTPGETSTIIVADAAKNLGRVCSVLIGDDGTAKFSVTSDRLYAPETGNQSMNLGTPIKIEYESLVDNKKVSGSSSGVTYSADSRDANPSGGRYGLLSFSGVNDYANLSLDIANAGEYDVELVYKVNEKCGKVSLGQNGSRVSESLDHSIGNLNSWKTQSVRLSFDKAGENILQIFYDGKGENTSAPANEGKSIRIDYIRLTPHTAVDPVVIEAESISGAKAQYGGSLSVRDSGLASSGKYLKATADAAGTVITLPIKVEQAGEYQVTLNYLAGTNGGRLYLLKDGKAEGNYIEQYSDSTTVKSADLGTMYLETEDEISFIVGGRSSKNTSEYSAFFDSISLSSSPDVSLNASGGVITEGKKLDLATVFNVVNMQPSYCIPANISYKVVSESRFDVGEVSEQGLFKANNCGTIIIRGYNKYELTAYKDYTLTVVPEGLDSDTTAAIKQINLLGEIKCTDACNLSIISAEEMYNKLTSEQKKQVSNYYILKAARNEYNILKNNAADSDVPVDSSGVCYVEDLDYITDGGSKITPGFNPNGSAMQFVEGGTIYEHGFGFEPYCDTAAATGTMVVKIPDGAKKFNAIVGLGVSASAGNTYDEKNVVTFKIGGKTMATTGTIMKNYANGNWVDKSVKVAFDIPEGAKWLVIENYNGGINHADHIILADAGFTLHEENAFEQIEAESFDERSSDIVIDMNSNASGGKNIGGVKRNSYIGFARVHFEKSAGSFTVCYSGENAGATGQIEIFVDNMNGTPVGVVDVPSTGNDWSNYATVECQLSKVIPEGVHKIYLKFVNDGTKAYVANVDWFKFGKYVEKTPIKVEGYQISTTLGGSRVVASVEPEINGQSVVEWGLIYGISKVGDKDFAITETDMSVDSENAYVKHYPSTPAGTLDTKLGSSDTATYFVRTMSFGAYTESAFNAQYKVRAYAVLSDGSYVYSDVEDYCIFNIAKKIYDNGLMKTQSAHDFLYEKILTVVDNNYVKVEFDPKKSIVKP